MELWKKVAGCVAYVVYMAIFLSVVIIASRGATESTQTEFKHTRHLFKNYAKPAAALTVKVPDDTLEEALPEIHGEPLFVTPYLKNGTGKVCSNKYARSPSFLCLYFSL